MSDYIRQAGETIWNWLPPLPPPRESVETVIVKEVPVEMLPRQGLTFVRLAGLSGAIAVAMGAYGAHGQSFVSFLCLFSIFFH